MTTTRIIASARMWIAAMALLVVLVGAAATVMGKVFVTQADMNDLRLNMALDNGDAKLRDWKLRTMQVQIDNMQMRQQRTDENVVKLLDRFRLEPAAEPTYKQLPPHPDSTSAP